MHYYRAGGLTEAVYLFLQGRDETVYILRSSNLTLVLLLVRFTEYDNDELITCIGGTLIEIVR
ncbi:hypothetical protein Hanom_Chr10g00924741 [Helianthus anomalus]